MISEKNKSGDSSLRDWFTKSRASDGTPGWVQLGGKYAGKPCARQPGQTTKPKCGSSKMKRNLDDEEEQAAFERKNRQDPNPDRRGKAKNVATEETKKDHEFSMARSELKTLKNAAKRLEKKMGKKGEGELEAWVQSKITKAADYIDTAADYVTNEEKQELRYCPKCKKAETRSDCAYGTGYWDKNSQPIEVEEAAGEKDACYKKVKSRYKVWPSAYASGALVKCRRVGASNWGNKTEGFTPAQILALEENGYIVDEGVSFDVDKKALRSAQTQEKIRSRTKSPNPHEAKVAKKKLRPSAAVDLPKYQKSDFQPDGEMVEDVTIEDANGNTFAEVIDLIKPDPITKEVQEAVRLPAKTGNIVMVNLTWKGKYIGIKIFFPYTKIPNRSDVQAEIEKVYPGGRVYSFQVSDYKPGETLVRVSEEKKKSERSY